MLPNTYRKLNYIENAELGSYIDTGFRPSDNTKVVVDGYVVDGDTAFLGERTSLNTPDGFTLQYTSEHYYRFNFNNNKVMAPVTYEKGIRHTFTGSKDGFFIDDDLIGQPTKKTLSTEHSIYMIGAMNTAEAAASFGIVRVYSIRFYDGEDLIADYIPCISEEEIYGLYEDVSGVFFSNAGTGAFTGDPEPFLGIEITSLPEKTIYQKGDEFDPEGMVVDAFCESGYREVVTDYEISGFDSSVIGIQEITVTYDGFTDTFPVVVNDVPVPEHFITLEEMKQYLRVDFEDDDSLIENLITASIKRCMDIARVTDKEEFEAMENAKIAVMFTVANQYEHREGLGQEELNLSLRALLFGDRKAGF